MGILTDLKKEAEALQQMRKLQSLAQEKKEQSVRETLSPSLCAMREYLKDLVEQLGVVDTATFASLPFKDFGQLSNLKQEDYELVSEGVDTPTSVSLYFTLRSNEQYQFDIPAPDNLQQKLEEFKAFGIKIRHAELVKTKQNGQRARIVLNGYVPVEITFKPDYDAGVIALAIRNFDQLGTRRYKLNPEQIDDEFLDEFSKYLLRMDNKFLKHEVSTAYRKRLRQRIADEQAVKQQQTDGKQPKLTTRIKSMFQRKPALALHYMGYEQEIEEPSDGFILGRGRNCDLVVNLSHVSRKHARLEFRQGKFLLIDQSLNGTSVLMEDGEEVRLQREELPLTGSGTISLGKDIQDAAEHVIRFEFKA